MRKLKSVIQYECVTSFKYIWVFYGIQYAVVLLMVLLINTITGNQYASVDCLEMNSFIYVGILGALGFNDDFKTLIQNGFTRKYIFIATFSMFCFISGIMALMDTVLGNLLHHVDHRYDSIYGALYGYNHWFTNWLWLFILYVAICSLLYLIILVINRIGKTFSLYLGIVLGSAVLASAALCRYVISPETVRGILEFLAKAMGFMPDGSINHLMPALSLLLAAGILGLGAYAVIRRTELK